MSVYPKVPFISRKNSSFILVATLVVGGRNPLACGQLVARYAHYNNETVKFVLACAVFS